MKIIHLQQILILNKNFQLGYFFELLKRCLKESGRGYSFLQTNFIIPNQRRLLN